MRGKLQKYCENTDLELPKYYYVQSSYPTEAQSNESPGYNWHSTVLVAGNYYSDECKFLTKEEAQSHIAAVAYKSIVKADDTRDSTMLRFIYIHKPTEWNIIVDTKDFHPVIVHGKPVHYYIFVPRDDAQYEQYKNYKSPVVTVINANSPQELFYQVGKIVQNSHVRRYAVFGKDESLASLLTRDNATVKHFVDEWEFSKFISAL